MISLHCDLKFTTETATASPQQPQTAKRNAFTRFLNGVEWPGNLLPHPVTPCAVLAVGIVRISGLLGWLGVAVEDPRPTDARGVAEDGMILAVSLMNGDGSGASSQA
ncbi:MAG: AbgT family transporter [Oceanicaulis sp.]